MQSRWAYEWGGSNMFTYNAEKIMGPCKWLQLVYGLFSKRGNQFPLLILNCFPKWMHTFPFLKH